MKKNIILILVVLVALSIFVGCKSTMPVNATSNTLGSKVGQSTQSRLFYIPIGGDGAIYEAARNGGITKISTVDQVMTDYAGIYQVVTTVVTGE